MTTTTSAARYSFYMGELRRAENPCATFTGFATSIGASKDYTKTEKGRALETLTAAWTDFSKIK